jgi:hypothetical protein
MPVNSAHPRFNAYLPRFQLVRDVVEGESVVKSKGTAYLPKLNGQSDDEYNRYKERAVFLEATSRTLKAWLGTMFRKDPVIEASEKTKEGWLSRCTSTGEDMESFLRVCCKEVLMTYRYGVLLDVANKPGASPYFVSYVAEDIVNWRYTEDDEGRDTLEMVVLHEIHEEKGADDFVPKRVVKYRVLKLVPGRNGKRMYQVELWKETEKSRKERNEQVIVKNSIETLHLQLQAQTGVANYMQGTEFVKENTITPKIKGRTLDYIPFVFITADSDGIDLDTAPLEPIARLNVSHYRNSADLEHGRHFTGLPTPWFFGVKVQQGEKINLGSETAITDQNSQASCGYLEFTGEGLKSLEKALEEKQSQMAALGARSMQEEKRASEAADTLRMKLDSDTSPLTATAKGVANGVNKLCKWAKEWDRSIGDVNVQINVDFSATNMDAQMLAQMWVVYLGGGISYNTFFYNLKRGGLQPDDRSIEDEVALISTRGPTKGNETPDDLDKTGDDDEDEDDGDDDESDGDDDEGQE